MKVVVCKDEDALALRLEMQVKFNDLQTRFAAQSKEHEHVVTECYRAMNYVLVGWLTTQGFKLP